MTVTRMVSGDASRESLIVVMSSDSLAAALVGALVETLGYGVRFHQPPEPPTATLRRERPDVAMLDGTDALMISDAVLGHAAMRNISVVVFGPRDALDAVRSLAKRHRIHTLIAPPTSEDVAAVLSEAFATRAAG